MAQFVPNAWDGAAALIFDMFFATDGGDVKVDTSTPSREEGDDVASFHCALRAHFSTARPITKGGSGAIIVLIVLSPIA